MRRAKSQPHGNLRKIRARAAAAKANSGVEQLGEKGNKNAPLRQTTARYNKWEYEKGILLPFYDVV